jgi:hypothetical protein
LGIDLGMEGLREFLEKIRHNHLARGHFRALLHVIIGRRITRSDGVVSSSGVTWRQLSELLRLIRWDKELVRELGLNPDDLPPRDRQRYWYAAIVAARVDTQEARSLGDAYAELLAPLGYLVGPAPGA